MIGVGITTRNRPDRLRLSLSFFKDFWPGEDTKLVIVDDHGKDTFETVSIAREFFDAGDFSLICNHENLGIAKSKNACLHELKECDYIFLFDDDCFVQKSGWEKFYINASNVSGCKHFNYLPEKLFKPKVETTYGNVDILSFDNCGGVMLFMTKEAVEKVGGYDSEYKTYGYEHAGYSHRMNRAGMTNKLGPYLSVRGCEEYIYSIDFNLVHFNEKPATSLSGDWSSSINSNDAARLAGENYRTYTNELTGKWYKPL